MDIRIKEENLLNKSFSRIIVKNSQGMKMTLLSIGASLYSLKLIKSGEEIEALIAPKSLEAFVEKDQYFGKTIGRVAGRIDKGILNFENKSISLEKNWNNISFLHGGKKGLSNKDFTFNIERYNDHCNIIFESSIQQKEDKIPGTLKINVIYVIYENENKFDIKFNYSCNKKSIANFTNHACFNLNGSGNVLKDKLYINASKCGYVNDELISTKIDTVNNVLDFTKEKAIGEFINDDSLKKHTCRGYDHPFILNSQSINDVACKLTNKDKSLNLTIRTTFPCMVIYTCNYPTNELLTNGEQDSQHNGICLECSFIPNSVNMGIDDSVVEPNVEYSNTISYCFE
ncbi:MAG: hypothetical protein ACI311_07665 [Bacilli bacterium]